MKKQKTEELTFTSCTYFLSSTLRFNAVSDIIFPFLRVEVQDQRNSRWYEDKSWRWGCNRGFSDHGL